MTTRQTQIEIQADRFFLNGTVTYPGIRSQGRTVEGLLLNTRMVQGIFDDLNPETRERWVYPDTGVWDPERNTAEFIEAMRHWPEHGVLAFTINLQGGSPYGYSTDQPWINSAVDASGTLRRDYLERLERILDRADELGMVAILGIFYFGQEKLLRDEAAIENAVSQTADWVLGKGYRNVLLEINNECNVRYQQPILQPARVHELISRAKDVTRDGRRLLVGTSYGGRRTIPGANVVAVSDFLLLHGNHVDDPDAIRQMVRDTRQIEGYTPKPILFNEDDHFGFELADNNFLAALDEYASWGYFDYRTESEGHDDGYQCVPVNWTISSPRKRGFFELARKISSGDTP